MDFLDDAEKFAQILGMSVPEYRRMIGGIDPRAVSRVRPGSEYANIYKGESVLPRNVYADYLSNSQEYPFRLGQDLLHDNATIKTTTSYANPAFICQNHKVERGKIISSQDGRYIFVHPADYHSVKRQLDEIAKNSPLTSQTARDNIQTSANHSTGVSTMPENSGGIGFSTFENFNKGMRAAIERAPDVKALHDLCMRHNETYRTEFTGSRLWFAEFEQAASSIIRRQVKRDNPEMFSMTVEAGKVTVFRQVANGFGYTGKKILEITAKTDEMESNSARVEFKLFNLDIPSDVWTYVKP